MPTTNLVLTAPQRALICGLGHWGHDDRFRIFQRPDIEQPSLRRPRQPEWQGKLQDGLPGSDDALKGVPSTRALVRAGASWKRWMFADAYTQMSGAVKLARYEHKARQKDFGEPTRQALLEASPRFLLLPCFRVFAHLAPPSTGERGASTTSNVPPSEDWQKQGRGGRDRPASSRSRTRSAGVTWSYPCPERVWRWLVPMCPAGLLHGGWWMGRCSKGPAASGSRSTRSTRLHPCSPTDGLCRSPLPPRPAHPPSSILSGV